MATNTDTGKAAHLGATLFCTLLAATATAQAPVAPPPGILGWWAFDDGARDLGPHGFDGALALAGGSFPAAMVQQGLQPQLPDGHVVVADAPELHASRNFTFESWVRVDRLASGLCFLMSKGTSDLRSTPYSFGLIGSDGVLVKNNGASVTGTRGPGKTFVQISDGSLEQIVIASTALPIGVFTHVAFTVVPVGLYHQCHIYIDGVERGYATVARMPFAGVQPLRLGGIAGGAALDGVLDEATLYDRALTVAEIRAIQAAGVGGKQKPVFDREPPVVTILQPGDGAVLGSRQVQLLASVTDDSSTQVDSVPVGLSAALPPGGGAFDGWLTLPAADGPQVLAVQAVDSAGNRAANSVLVTVDTTPPVVQLLAPAEGAVLSASPVALAIDVEDLTAATVQVGGGSQALPPGHSALRVDVPLVEGDNLVTVIVTDSAGNLTTVVRHVVLDLSAPLVAITDPADGALFGPGQDLAAVTVRVDDLTATDVRSLPAGLSGSLLPGGGILTGVVPLQEGLNQLVVIAADGSGRNGSAGITVNRDSTAPTVQFMAPGASAGVHGSVQVLVDAADIAPGSGIARIDLLAGSDLIASVAGELLSLDLDTALLADGDHLLRAVATDGAGNQGEEQLLIRVDNTPPDLRILTPGAGEVVAGMVPFSAVASDQGIGVATVVQRVGGRAPSQDGSASFAPALPGVQIDGSEDSTDWPNGAVPFEVEACDEVGNRTVVQIEVSVQNTALDAPGLRPRDGARVHGRVQLQVCTDRADVLDLELQVDGQRIALGHGTRLRAGYDSTSRLDGPMEIRAIVRSAAGTAETVHVVQVDNLRVVALAPHALTLADGRRGERVRARVSGPDRGVLRQLARHRVELRVPGGSSLAMVGVTVVGGRERSHAAVEFDRAALIAVLRAACATGAIPPHGERVVLQLCVDGACIGRADLELRREVGRGHHR